jgi:YHS domain-containing protein
VIRFVIFALLCYILYRLIKSLALPSPRKSGEPFRKPGEPFTQSPQVITDEMVIDPHCHVYIPKREALTAKIEGETVYFCSKECKKKYLQAKH